MPGIKTALTEVALCTVAPGERMALPDPGYPDYNSAVALAEAERVSLPLDAAGRPDGTRSTAVRPCSSTSTIRRTRPRRLWRTACSRRPSRMRSGAVQRCCTTSRTATSSSTAGRRGASWRSLAPGRSGSSSSRCRRATGWPAGAWVRRRECRARRAGHVAAGARPRRHLRPVAACGDRGADRPQETVAERRALYEARRDRVFRNARASSRACEGTFFVWLRLPEESTAPGRCARRASRSRPGGLRRAGPGARSALPRGRRRRARRRAGAALPGPLRG